MMFLTVVSHFTFCFRVELESGVEIITPTEERKDLESEGPFQMLKRISTARNKSQRKRKNIKFTNIEEKKKSSGCCKIS